mmetsp:Transcript_47825/g.89032  ORF Transcript_47825/g.89032 Transcript_47825/m.89032 type:complete len:387 (+) Transcript_47825:1064-2224(+)
MHLPPALGRLRQLVQHGGLLGVLGFTQQQGEVGSEHLLLLHPRLFEHGHACVDDGQSVPLLHVDHHEHGVLQHEQGVQLEARGRGQDGRAAPPGSMRSLKRRARGSVGLREGAASCWAEVVQRLVLLRDAHDRAHLVSHFGLHVLGNQAQLLGTLSNQLLIVKGHEYLQRREVRAHALVVAQRLEQEVVPHLVPVFGEVEDAPQVVVAALHALGDVHHRLVIRILPLQKPAVGAQDLRARVLGLLKEAVVHVHQRLLRMPHVGGHHGVRAQLKHLLQAGWQGHGLGGWVHLGWGGHGRASVLTTLPVTYSSLETARPQGQKVQIQMQQLVQEFAQNMRVKMLLQMLMAFAHMRTSLVGLANKGRRTQHPSILEQTMGSTVASPICG